MRLTHTDPDDTREAYAANKLLKLELKNLDTQAQFNELIRADLNFLSGEFAEVLCRPTPADVDALVTCYGAGSRKQQQDLLILLSIHPIPFSDSAWSWIADFTKKADQHFRGLAFQTLTHSDTVRFGRTLAVDGWSWSPDALGQSLWHRRAHRGDVRSSLRSGGATIGTLASAGSRPPSRRRSQ